jgi:MFS transporter, MCT family, solute carrier family 16 (monocarboxylic acid transporters), member 10
MPGRSAFNTMLRSLINFDIWKQKRYIIWSLSIPIALFGYFVPYVHMGKFVKDNFPGQGENYPVMCIGIASGVGRIIFGFIADMPKIDRILLQQIAFVAIGLLSMCLPMTSNFGVLLGITLTMGLFDGCFIALLGPIAYDICGSAGAAQAIGFLLGLSSVPLTVGPPIGKQYLVGFRGSINSSFCFWQLVCCTIIMGVTKYPSFWPVFHH